MDELKARIKSLHSSFLARSNRERWMILGVCWVVVAWLGMTVYEHTLQAALKDQEQQATQQQAQLEEQAQQEAELANTVALLTRSQQEHDQQLLRLERRLASINNKVDERMRTIVTPEQMSSLLLSILKQSKGFSLVELSNQPPVLLTPAKPSSTDEPEEEEEEVAEPLYRHGLTLVLNGSYMSLLSYVDLLEQLSGQIFWRALEFEIEEYPKANVRLEFFTISQEKELLRG